MQSYSCKPTPPTREIHIRANYNQQTSNMEEKTTTNEDNDTLETPLINGRRESMELEQVSLETNADESIWLKILCFLGGVYPILRENGKCKCNWKTIGWSILPLVWTCFFSLVIIIILSSPSRSTFESFELVWYALLGSFIFFFIPLSLSYTRKRFSDAIVGEENRSYVNTLAKRYTLGVFLFSLFVSFFVPLAFNRMTFFH